MENKEGYSLTISSDSPPPLGQYLSCLLMLFFFLVLLIFLAAPEDYLRLGVPLLVVAAGVATYSTVYFYSRYELRVSSRNIEWKSEILPGKIVQNWKEKTSSYKEIGLVKIKPFESERTKIAFAPELIGYPIRKPTGRGMINTYNRMECAVVVLRHKTNPKRNVSLRYFPMKEADDLKVFLNSVAQGLNLPLTEMQW